MSALSFTAAVAPANRRVFASAKKTSAAKKAFRVSAYTEERRYDQTMKVMDRTQEVRSMRELEAAMNLAGDSLIIVALESDEECVAGDQAACKEVTASLARIARDCKDVIFISAEVTHSGPEAREIAEKLGVNQFPTYQYYKVRFSTSSRRSRRGARGRDRAIASPENLSLPLLPPIESNRSRIVRSMRHP
jgi:thiol:disulfide interchange protein